eukprot:196097-Amphidinium_carterae.1
MVFCDKSEGLKRVYIGVLAVVDRSEPREHIQAHLGVNRAESKSRTSSSILEGGRSHGSFKLKRTYMVHRATSHSVCNTTVLGGFFETPKATSLRLRARFSLIESLMPNALERHLSFCTIAAKLFPMTAADSSY